MRPLTALLCSPYFLLPGPWAAGLLTVSAVVLMAAAVLLLWVRGK